MESCEWCIHIIESVLRRLYRHIATLVSSHRCCKGQSKQARSCQQQMLIAGKIMREETASDICKRCSQQETFFSSISWSQTTCIFKSIYNEMVGMFKLMKTFCCTEAAVGMAKARAFSQSIYVILLVRILIGYCMMSRVFFVLATQG